MSVTSADFAHAPVGDAVDPHRRQIALWLLVCCGLVFCMVILGGATRLTGSGLSMVHWKPVTGVIPPMDQSTWEREFSAYQRSPEYQKINLGMSLDEFKQIFWFEFAHRLLGRSIGLVFLLPFLYFWIRRRIPRALAPKLVAIFVLGGLQGVLGWYMVKSGLVDNPHVSQYRLTAHLVAALLIYAYMLWVALGLLTPRPPSGARDGLAPLRRYGLVLTTLVVVTIVSGGFVAGLKAGYAYNTFPLMGGQLIPEGILQLQPVHLNFFENIATVQFDHRVLAISTLVTAIGFWFFSRRFDLGGRTRLGFSLMAVAALIQVSLGIATLLLHVPVSVAVIHQGGAIVLFTAALFLNHELRG
jgi:heme a synthase